MNAFRFAVLKGLIGLVLLSGCSGGGDAAATAAVYARFHEALQKGDIPAMKQHVASARSAELAAAGVEAMVAMVKEMTPREVTVLETKIEGTNATLVVEGQLKGQFVEGTAMLLKEGSQWKVSREDWKIDLTALVDPPVVTAFVKNGKTPKVQLTLTERTAVSADPKDKAAVTELAFTRDGHFLVSASYDTYALTVWDAATGNKLSGVKLENRPTCVRLTPDDSRIVVGTAYGDVTLWPLENGTIGAGKQIVPSRNPGEAGIHATFAISPNGKYIAVSGHNSPIFIRDLATGNQVAELKDNPAPQKLAFSPNGRLLATVKNSAVSLWDVKRWKAKTYTMSKVDKAAGVGGIHFSPDGRLLVLGFLDSSIVVFDIETRKEVHNFATQTGIWDVDFSPDGSLYLAAQENKVISLFKIKTAERVGRLTDHQAAVRCLAFSPDGAMLASAADESRILLWRSP